MKKIFLTTMSTLLLTFSVSQNTFADAVCLGFTWDDCNMVKRDVRLMSRGWRYGPIQGVGTTLLGIVLFVPALVVDNDMSINQSSLLESIKESTPFLGSYEQSLIAESIILKFNEEREVEGEEHILKLTEEEVLSALEASDIVLNQQQVETLTELTVVVK